MVNASVMLNALALFLPAMIGVFGSYGIYRKRQSDTKSNLREAFIAEMEGTEYLDIWPETGRTVPAFNFLSVSVYESNTDNLGVLTEEEVSAIVQYYTRAKSVQDVLRLHSEIIAQTTGLFASDEKLSDRKSAIRGAIDKLELARLRAIIHIKNSREGTTIPQKEDRLSNFGTRLEQDEVLLLDYGFAKRLSPKVSVISAYGAKFFQGNVQLTDLSKERDILNREKHPLQRKIETLWKWLQTLVNGSNKL